MDNDNNRVTLGGAVLEPPRLSHVNHNVAFYKFTLSSPRRSGQTDDLPVIVSRRQLEALPLAPGDAVTVAGQLRSYNNRSGQGSRLVLSVFAYTLDRRDQEINEIWLTGALCRPPTVRRTPLGREICDLLLAVNRRCGRADYLPCIAWGAVADRLGALPTGSRISVQGRLQSRIYTKRLGSDAQQRVAYEVSIMSAAACTAAEATPATPCGE